VLSAHHDSESCSKDKNSRNVLAIELKKRVEEDRPGGDRTSKSGASLTAAAWLHLEVYRE
jgi:hypothetical protein